MSVVPWAGDVPKAFPGVPVDQPVAIIEPDAGREQRFATVRNPSHAIRIRAYVQRTQIPLPRVPEERVLIGASRVGTQQRAGSSGRGDRRMVRMTAIHPKADLAAGIQHHQLRSLFGFILPHDQRRAAVVAQMNVLAIVLRKWANHTGEFTLNHVTIVAPRLPIRASDNLTYGPIQ